jgi:integrase
MPKKPPPEVQAALADFGRRETAAKQRGHGYVADRTVAEFLQDHKESYAISREPGSLGELVKAVKVFLDWCESKKISRLDGVTPEVCHNWMDERARTTSKRTGKPIAYATLKKERAMLSTAWSLGLRKGAVLSNPWKDVEVPGSPPRKKRGSWSPTDYEKILAQCNTWLRDLIIVGCHTGLRIEALRGIEWRDVLWNEDPAKEGFGFLEVRPELDKTHKGYVVPIHPRVHDVFARRLIHRPAGVDTILTGMQGRPIATSNMTTRAIVRACHKAGLKTPDSPNHHMRRTFGRWAILGHLTGKPVPMYVVSRWMGHSSIDMTESYLDMKRDDSTGWMLGDDRGDTMPTAK